MTEIQGKSILVRVSARFELVRVRVIGSQLYIFLVSAYDVMEHFAFPGNIDFAADDQGFDVFIHRL